MAVAGRQRLHQTVAELSSSIEWKAEQHLTPLSDKLTCSLTTGVLAACLGGCAACPTFSLQPQRTVSGGHLSEICSPLKQRRSSHLTFSFTSMALRYWQRCSSPYCCITSRPNQRKWWPWDVVGGRGADSLVQTDAHSKCYWACPPLRSEGDNSCACFPTSLKVAEGFVCTRAALNTKPRWRPWACLNCVCADSVAITAAEALTS